MSPLISGITLLEPSWAMLAPIGAAVALLLLLCDAFRRRNVRTYFDQADAPRFASMVRRLPGTLGALAIGTSVAMIALSLARPANNPKPVEVKRTGRDTIFVIDVSRSMLAADLAPSRLERAKLNVSDVLDTVQGDRIGIIAFAGTAVVKCPLTTDYTFARMTLESLNTDSAPRGGTNIGDALRSARSMFFTGADPVTAPQRPRTLIVMTDGEDHASQPVAVAKELGELGVRIVTLGLGSDVAGAPLPEDPSQPRSSPTGLATYNGQVVHSKMDPTTLRQIAEATPGGVFLNVGTSNIELDSVYAKLMRDVQRAEVGGITTMKYTHLFQLTLAGALLLLAMEGLTHVRR